MGPTAKKVTGRFNRLFPRLSFIPAMAIFSTAFFYWESLREFYLARQLWLGLVKPQHTSKSLTLDYFNSRLAICRAFRHLLWTVLFMIAGSWLHLPMPIILMTFQGFEWRMTSTGQGTVQRRHVWSDYPQFVFNSTNLMNNILKSSIASVSSPSKLPFWSSYRLALLPVELQTNRSSS